MTGALAKVTAVTNAIKEAWWLVEKSESVVNINADQANAVPDGADWTSDLTGAQGPNYKDITYKSSWYIWVPFADDIESETTVTMRVFWMYGAKYKGGGAFIPTARVEVVHLDPGYNNDIDISVSVGQPTNVGTDTAPNAALPLSITVKEDSMVPGQDNHETYTVMLYGTGHGQVY
jgi:hypothetical protein